MATETSEETTGSSGGVQSPPMEGEGDLSEAISRTVRDISMAYEQMEMPIRRYLALILFPSGIMGAGIIVGSFLLTVPVYVRMPLMLLGLFLPFIAVVYPKIMQDRKRNQVRERFHLFITHITVLSTTNIDRVEIFRTLANEDEYQAIAQEMGHIVALIDTWNQSLEDACRMRAQRVSSPLLQDFFERLAYTVGAGQAMSEFLVNEQDSIIQHFSVRYESQLERLALVKELYMSITMSTTFALVFATLVPFITGIDPALTLSVIVVLYLFVQVMFLYVLNNVAPQDPVWFYGEEQPLERNIRVRIAFIVAMVSSLGLMAWSYGALQGFLPGGGIPVPLFLAIPFTPLLLPGVIMRREENRVKDRDDEFPSFIRALGTVEGVKQSSTSSVLRTLREKDFGALTENVDDLYKRLSMRIDSNQAWRNFAAESGSYLIQKFGDMYVTGRRMGGAPRQLGNLIDQNLTEVLKLRQKRSQEVGTVVGTIYGLTATTTFAFFVGLEVVNILQEVTAQMGTDQGVAGMSGVLNAGVYNIPQIQLMLFLAVLINTFLSSMMIRVIDRGHSINAFPHFVMQTWMAAIIAVVTKILVGSFISI
jgi:flagellar protein FlaJ